MTEPEAPEVVPEQPPPARPTWTYFLTPIAVLIGSIVIGGFVLLGWALYGDDSGSDTPVTAVQEPAGGFSSAATSPTPTGSLKTVFTGYAKQLGLDQQKWVQCAANQATADALNNQIKEGAKLGVTGTPTFFINNKMIVGAQPFSVLKEVIDDELKGSPTTIDGYSDTIKAMANQDPPYFKIVDSKPDISGAQIEGDKDAKVMVVEFTDFQCPFCERWYQQDLPQLRKLLGNDVALAFMNFPIPQIHPNAGPAAIAAQCAANQGKFWQMHDLLFSNQAVWEGLPST